MSKKTLTHVSVFTTFLLVAGAGIDVARASVPNLTYRQIKNKSTERCLTAEEPTPGRIRANLIRCEGTTAQNWEAYTTPGGGQRIESFKYPGQCIMAPSTGKMGACPTETYGLALRAHWHMVDTSFLPPTPRRAAYQQIMNLYYMNTYPYSDSCFFDSAGSMPPNFAVANCNIVQLDRQQWEFSDQLPAGSICAALNAYYDQLLGLFSPIFGLLMTFGCVIE